MKESVRPLISLDPLGVGTSRVESLDSYAHRVAAAHRVPRTHVDKLVGLRGQPLLRPKSSPLPISLNGPSERALAYGTAIAEMTGRPQATYLNLGVFSGVISQIGAQRQVRAWCNDCIRDSRARGEEPYWPLVWSIPDYVVCHLHGTALTWQCSTCFGTTRLKLLWKGSLFACRHCSRPLGVGGGVPVNPQQFAPSEFQAYERIASFLLGEFVTDVVRIRLGGLAVGNNIQRLVHHVGEIYGITPTPGAMARLAGISKGTAHSLSHGTLLPSLSVLTRLAVVFDVSISGLICPDLWRSKMQGAQDVKLAPRIRAFVKKDWEQIRKAAQNSASSRTPMTLYRLLQDFGACPKAFQLKFKQETLELRRKVTAHRESEFEKRVEELAVKLAAAEKSLALRGGKVSERKLCRVVGVDRSKRLYKLARKLTLQ